MEPHFPHNNREIRKTEKVYKAYIGHQWKKMKIDSQGEDKTYLFM